MENEKNRPPIETLACPYTDCQLYSQKGLGNLTVRKIYSRDQIRYLRCRACLKEFSERKNTALFGTKIAEQKAVSVAEHLSEGVSTKGTSRLVGVSPEAIRRLRTNLGEHAEDLHDEYVQEVEATAVQMDERYGYVKSKAEPFWEATAIEPESRLLVGFVGGRRDEALIKELMETTRDRLSDPTDLVLMSDGQRSYEALFASIFGQPYRPARSGERGRFPNLRYRINRDLGHLQVIKHRRRGRVVKVISRAAHGSWKRVNRELERLAYNSPNLSAVERQNGTARQMNAYMVRKSLAFGRTEEGREALGWFSTVVYNFCRTQRALRQPLSIPRGRRCYEQRTPAMAAKLTGSIWTVSEVLRTPVYWRGGTG